jgi:hypothetical protein
MPDIAQSELAAAIAREEARLAELEVATEQARQRVSLLREQQRASVPEAKPPTAPAMASSEKIALFRSLFRGRTDVFPKLWVNTKTEKRGYAPACANEWVRGVCEKPRVKCGECPNQAFIAVDDRVVADHLQGRPAGFWRRTSTRARGATTSRHSQRLRVLATSQWRSSVRAQGTALMHGSSSRRPWRRASRARWGAFSSLGRWNGATN